MRELWLGRRAAGLVTALALLVVVAAGARAEDYVLGPDDVVAVSVWMHPELERTLTINADGNVMLPPVGEIKAAGLTAKQLSDKVADRLSAYLRTTTTVTVTVQQFLSHSVYVTGAVAKPGRYGFERFPTLVEVLGQAGGALPGADLSAVQVLRKEGDARRTIAADLSSALRTGDASGLPALRPGDTVVIPGAAAGGQAAAPGDGVGVLGEVTRPGLYPAAAGQDLWSLIATAGGLTARGNFADVRVLSRSEGGQTVSRVDLRDALEHGSRAIVPVKAGDVVVVMPRGGNAWATFTGVLALSRDALNVAVLLDYFNNRQTR